MINIKKSFVITDEIHTRLKTLLQLRLPWLLFGLIGGIAAAVFVSRFENTISENISLAFFLPIIIYLSDAVGTQTENIYIRSLAIYKDSFWKYMIKEVLIGLFLGALFGLVVGGFAYFWVGSLQIGLVVGISMLINTTIAPVIALLMPEILFKEHRDPALGAGPFTTIIQDVISLVVYFIIAITIL